ncbi:nucleotide sugar dehydrogenase [Dinghuibacter silviterrae]|uniref:UDP-N-acetyl-D-galactosamine dehydrogenase n=1 Tax=Dinghuibacter silviterrae TaxID=1539049 RepID=A0A4R8DQG5_9BACT|nr:nucleotide sugar dehydrogenase [Dinghuibacter silviterrae]TDX00026.1 UDP-N-acetyl-D-galactosamine dehydrogenase [Dinghuibacter silviterrae]
MSDVRNIAIIGLGYVGLPLAAAFARKHVVTGFDINPERVAELTKGFDKTLEVGKKELEEVRAADKGARGLFVTHRREDLETATFYIVTVPTPVDKYNRPDLGPLYKASETVGKVLKKGDIVVYESTVYPGVTEEECVPVLERVSGLRFNVDFFAGYSPERINPGDKEHTVTKILKVTSGSTPEAAKTINDLYASVISAGTFQASSIRVAEAAKVIENSQRDINIAFVNELSKIFTLLGIDTREVLEAAGTKWNFLRFTPGLVGGHCIGVDPYYLTQKAQEVGYHPEIILAGRRLNDGMGAYVAEQVVKQMVRSNIPVNGSDVLVLGFTFKENCPDVRNTRVIDIYRELESYHVRVTLHDPRASAHEVLTEYGIPMVEALPKGKVFDAIILAVAHEEFLEMDIREMGRDDAVLFDVKAALPRAWGALRL